MYDVQQIGAMIREMRIFMGKTQKEVADLAGMPDSALRKYESGRQIPTIETLHRIADALGVKLYTLISGEKRLLMLSQIDDAMAEKVTRIVDDYMLLDEESRSVMRKRVDEVLAEIESKHVRNIGESTNRQNNEPPPQSGEGQEAKEGQ